MNNFNNSNNSTPDATSMANVRSGHGKSNFLFANSIKRKISFTLDLGMRHKYGGEELEDPKDL